ncbi:MAG: methyltransferase domain-containing protein [Vicinamibacterales bacterium]|nr:methyltransferase domain-containing protein [Vicinamibacterales bacterium]
MRIDNSWNQRRYGVWAPVYDAMARTLARAREDALAGIAVGSGESVLIVGAGTGLDLPLLPAGARVVATDLTPAMLSRARARAPSRHFAYADAEQLGFPDACFDVVLLHFIVAVVADSAACLREAARVTRPGGRISLLDKFVPDGRTPSLTRRALNVLAHVAFSDITVDLSAALRASGSPLEVVSRRPVAFGGRYEAVVLRRT